MTKWARLGALALACAGGCADSAADGRVRDAVASEPTRDSAAARAVLEAARARFGSLAPLEAISVTLDRTQTGFVPRFGAGSGRMRTSIPRRADGPLEIREVTSGVSVEATLLGARPVEAEVAEGWVVHPHGGPADADILHRGRPDGSEDWLAFAAAPPREEARYEIVLGPAVAGLRSVGGGLELLDGAGAPRLRVAPPFLLDARGWRIEVTLAVEGCAVERSAAAPWGRAPVPPGAARCEIVLGWGGRGVVYPALLDPLWTDAGTLASVHARHAATLLADGRVLVSAGVTTPSAIPTAITELYDPPSGTWAQQGSMALARYRHTQTLLPDGTAIAVGGIDVTDAAVASTELYDPATGDWSPGPSLSGPRYRHVAVALADGSVLVAGGDDDVSSGVATAAVYDHVSASWTPVGNLLEGRFSPAAVRLPDGRVLVAGGFNQPGAHKSAELYDPTTQTFSATGTMVTGRGSYELALLGDGRVLAAGGLQQSGLSVLQVTVNAELYNPATGSWTPTAPMPVQRYDHTVTALQSGLALVAGGVTASGAIHKNAELYDVAAAAWVVTEPMQDYRYRHTANRLLDGSVLVVAGDQGGAAPVIDRAELFRPLAGGDPCIQGAECLSGFCADGVCCDAPCGELCVSCLEQDTGQPDGVCADIAAGTDPAGECIDDGAPGCEQNGFCERGACGVYPGNGCEPSPCAEDSDCSTGHCTDGICCDAVCDGECQACLGVFTGNFDGLCSPILVGTDPEDECADDGTTNCGKILLCNGSDACVAANETCAPFVCLDAGGCKASCASDEDCAPTHRCQDGDCVVRAPRCDGAVLVAADDTREECSPYACDAAAQTCKAICESVADCADGFVCNESGVCGSLTTAAEEEDEGCACRVPRDRARAPGGMGRGAAALAACLLAIARRRRRPVCRFGAK